MRIKKEYITCFC